MKTSRREFSKSLVTGMAALGLPGAVSRLAVAEHHPAVQKAGGKPFSFSLLGDLHFDKLTHHKADWLQQEHPNDVHQVANYSRITADVHPELFATVRETISSLKAGGANVPFVLQVGDLVEGLCGSEELAVQQDTDAVHFFREANLGVPFVFIKGNHDITGPGAPEAFKSVLTPFLAEEAAPLSPTKFAGANYSFEHEDCLFCCYDAYDNESLGWLESRLQKRTARHCFVVVHMPVVPYGARADWALYVKGRNQGRRDHLLEMLGQQDAIVLGGHIHKYNWLTRTTRTPRGGRFTQLGVSSIISRPGIAHASNELSGPSQYNPDQIRVEPNFSPGTEAERREIYVEEAPFVTQFQYADLPGHALVTVDGNQVTAKMYAGTSQELWRTVQLAG